jgi:phage shock protein A
MLEAALIGYQSQRDAIQRKIEDIRSQLGQGGARKAVATASAPKVKKAHRISPEGLKRIRDAQKRRWAAAKAKAQAANA